MDKNKHIFLDDKDCIPKDMLIRYVNDQLDARERHRVEKHAIDCAMCSDAIEGLMEMKDPSKLKGIIDGLDRRVMAKEQSGPKILWMDTRVRVAAAAGAALLIGLVYFFNRNLNSVTNEKTVSENLPEKTKENKPDTTTVRLDTTKTALERKDKDEDKKDDQLNPTGNSGTVPVPDAKDAKGNTGSGGKQELKQTQQDGPTYSLTKSKKITPPPSDNRSGEDENYKDVPKKQDEVKKESDKSDKYYTGNTVDNNTSKTEKPNNDKTVDDSEGTRNEEQKIVLSDKMKEKDLEKHTEEDQKVPSQTNSNGGNFGFSSKNQTTAPQPKSNVQENNDADGKMSSDSTTTISQKLDSVSYRKELEDGISDYKSKNYKKAEISFKETLRSNPADRKSLFYLGSTYLDQGKPDLAIEQFDKVIALGNGEYYDDARYKKSEALIQQNKKSEAKKILDDLIRENGPMRSKALDLEKK